MRRRATRPSCATRAAPPPPDRLRRSRGAGVAAPDVSTGSSPLSTPRIASISESETPASRAGSSAFFARTVASTVRRFDSAISARASSSRTLSESERARLSASSRAWRASRASSRADRRAARISAASRPDFDQAIDHGATEVGVRAGARLRTSRRRGTQTGRARAPSERLLLARLDGPAVEQPVGTLCRFEAPASDQRAYRSRCGQGIGEPELTADLGRRHRHHLADLVRRAASARKALTRSRLCSFTGPSCPTGGPRGQCARHGNPADDATPARLRAMTAGSQTAPAPLAGLRVIDLSRVLAGPLAHDDAGRPGRRRREGRASRRRRRHRGTGGLRSPATTPPTSCRSTGTSDRSRSTSRTPARGRRRRAGSRDHAPTC